MAIYTFHVTIAGLDNLWRKISISGEQTLSDLHMGIQRAFDFDADHMYSFYLSGKAWDKATEYSIPDSYSMGRPKRISQKDKEAVYLNLASQVMNRPKTEDIAKLSDFFKRNAERGEKPDMAELKSLFNKNAAVSDLELLMQFRFLLTEWLDFETSVDRNVFESKIEKLPLKIGQSMLYLFDYGDEWHFKVLLWDIDAATKIDKRTKYPKTIAEFGEAPEQYGHAEDFDFDDFDEDEDDDDEDNPELAAPQIILPNLEADSQDLSEGIPPDLPKFLYRWYVQVKRPLVEPDKAAKDISSKAINAFLENEFKPRFAEKIKAASCNWFKRFCYVQVSLKDGTEKKLLRLEHAGEGRFHLSGLDAKGKWREDYEYLPLKYCLIYLLEEKRYHP